MKKYKIIPGEAARLSIKEEIDIVKIFARIVTLNKYIFFAFNICVDHVHFIIYCPHEKLQYIIRKIKTKTSVEYKQEKNVNLWAQKFNREIIETNESLARVVDYIRYNRFKHGCVENAELQKEIDKFLTPFDNF